MTRHPFLSPETITLFVVSILADEITMAEDARREAVSHSGFWGLCAAENVGSSEITGSQGVKGSNPFSSTERERRNLSNSWGFVAFRVGHIIGLLVNPVAFLVVFLVGCLVLVTGVRHAGTLEVARLARLILLRVSQIRLRLLRCRSTMTRCRRR